jgi:hypothetical protein
LSGAEQIHELPDGRRVAAVYDGEREEWDVRLVDREGDPISHRAIQEALKQLLEPDEPTVYGSGNWFWNAVDFLGTVETPEGRRAPCPCCGELTFRRGARHSYEMCEVCWWEDDGSQYQDPDLPGGANRVSLREAQQIYKRYGVCERQIREKG